MTLPEDIQAAIRRYKMARKASAKAIKKAKRGDMNAFELSKLLNEELIYAKDVANKMVEYQGEDDDA